MSSATVAITFPDLSPAEASLLAQEISTALVEDGVPAANITRQRASADAQDMGTVIMVAAGAYLLELAQEFGKGAANKAGSRFVDAILRKWGTRAKFECPGRPPAVLGNQHRRASARRTIEQAHTLADLKSLGVVLLGASTFPNYPTEKKLDNPAFKRSADLARELLSPRHTVFREAHVLDLFDQDLRPDQIVDAIEDHVLKYPDMRDVVLYYCGHGDFLPDRDRTYYLTLKGTRPGRESATGLGLKGFRQMIEAQAHLLQRRCTFILDCCFAGAAVDAFQLSGIDPMIAAQVQDLPSRGFALMTAADRNLPAIGRDGNGATMFTGALADVLRAVTPHAGGRQVSLSDVCAETARLIKSKHGLDGVVPQCHAPTQSDGDVSRVPMFLIGSTQPFGPATAPHSGVAQRTMSGAVVQPQSEVALAAAEWKQLKTSGDPRRLHSFARQFPGYYGELATAKAVELEAAAAKIEGARKEAERKALAERQHRHDLAWATAEKAASVEAFEQFLAEYAESPEAHVVRQNLPGLREHERLASAAWEDVRSTSDAGQLGRFARHFPGKYAELAKSRIDHLSTQSGGSSNYWVKFALAALAVLTAVRIFLFQPTHISSAASGPTRIAGVNNGYYFLINKFRYGYSSASFPFFPRIFSGRHFALQEPQIGDLVAYRRADSSDWIGRIVAVPRDEVVVSRDGTVSSPRIRYQAEASEVVFVGGRANGFEVHADGRYPVRRVENGRLESTKISVPTNSYLVMFDDRTEYDTAEKLRTSIVPTEHIVGPLAIVWWGWWR